MDRLTDKQTVPWRPVDRPVTPGWTEPLATAQVSPADRTPSS